MREQGQFRSLLLPASEGAKQPGKRVTLDLRIDDDPAGSVRRLLIDDRVVDRDLVEPGAKRVEIEEIRADAQDAESLAGNRVAARPVEFRDPHHEGFRTDGTRGQRRPVDLPVVDGEVGVEGPLLDALRVGPHARVFDDDRGPLLEVDAHPHSEPGVQTVEETTVETAEGHVRLDRRGAPARWHGETIAKSATGARASGCIGRLNRVTDAAPPTYAAPPPGPDPVAMAIAHDLVTRYRLRLADQRDGRLGDLLGHYVLAAAMWTGPRAGLVAFYEPPADPALVGPDLAARCDAARRWGLSRLREQGAEVCDILLIALGPLAGTLSAATTPGDPVRLGVAWVDTENANAGAVLPIPPGMPSVGELRTRARAVHDGAPTPTLAAVDLAERQTVAGGYVAPVRRAMVTQPYLTYALIAVFVVIWVLEYTTLSLHSTTTGPDICSWGALPNAEFYPPLGQSPACGVAWWRLISSSFLHDPSSVYHVLFNSIAMLFIGRLVEQLYGRLVLLGVFLITATGGGLLWVAASTFAPSLPGIAPTSISLGASGGIAGLIGLLLMVGRVQGKNVPVGITHTVRNYAVTVIVLNVVLTFVFGPSLDINNYAHIGGLATGALLGCVLSPIMSIGGRDHRIVEKAVLWGAIAFSAVALLFALLNLAAAIMHPLPPFAG